VAIDRRVRQTYLDFQSDFAAVSAPADLDQDGLPDSWEYRAVDALANDPQTNLLSVLAEDDFDQDGASNYAEYVADTDPTSAQFSLRFTGIVRSNSLLRLTWRGGTGATQFLERATALNPAANWVRVLTNLPPTALTHFYDDATSTDGTNWFYRLRVAR